jgi:3',5'-cyclic AMP phosphodiesterase CpdA
VTSRAPPREHSRHPAPVGDGQRGFVLAHLSDPHVPHRLSAHPTALLNKRVFGYLTWHLRRVRVHRREVLDALAADLAAHAVDHVAVTGDIVNIALPSEFRRAGEWLRTLSTPAELTVVPGNHDAYVAVSWERSWSAWHDFMTSDGEKAAATGDASVRSGDIDDGFPIFRRRGPIALIGLSTAVPTSPGKSSGRVGKRQLERLDEFLERAGNGGLFRVVLLHHPPRAQEAPKHKQLTDAEQFRAVIAAKGAELILHGHEHRFRYVELAGPGGIVPVFGVPSASMLPAADGSAAGQYHLHDIGRQGAHWSIRTSIRTFSTAHGGFVESHRRSLLLPAKVFT